MIYRVKNLYLRRAAVGAFVALVPAVVIASMLIAGAKALLDDLRENLRAIPELPADVRCMWAAR